MCAHTHTAIAYIVLAVRTHGIINNTSIIPRAQTHLARSTETGLGLFIRVGRGESHRRQWCHMPLAALYSPPVGQTKKSGETVG
jgi:hypothetical protein